MQSKSSVCALPINTYGKDSYLCQLNGMYKNPTLTLLMNYSSKLQEIISDRTDDEMANGAGFTLHKKPFQKL